MKQKLLTQNTKLKKDGIWAFNLPPIATCPCAGDCKSYCYAKKGFYNMPTVKRGLQKRFLISKAPGFTDLINWEVGDKKFVRIHASGDFYSFDYLLKWVRVAIWHPDTTFYCYTKSVAFVKQLNWYPPNLRFIFSYGGLQDSLIDPNKDRHCRIFDTKAELDKARYVDVSNSDLIAATTESLKIGIVKH